MGGPNPSMLSLGKSASGLREPLLKFHKVSPPQGPVEVTARLLIAIIS